jgi:hypothetical protein
MTPKIQRPSKTYKQLGLDGSTNDYNCISELDGFTEMRKALDSFFTKNKDVNPRQLQYIIAQEANDISLDEMIGIRF